MKYPLKAIIARILQDRYCRASFMSAIPRNGRVLDVGCGNDSPLRAKAARPDIYYVGIDVGDYNQTSRSKELCDEYLLVGPEDFENKITERACSFDAVISCHNIEHCFNPGNVLSAMLDALKPGGRLYLSFPSEASVTFPSRKGTLNFHDDASHREVPNFREIIGTIEKKNCDVDAAFRQYVPLYRYVLGALTELPSRALNRVLPGTWSFWGFESIIWASKPRSN